MNAEQHKRADELRELINVTYDGLSILRAWKEKSRVSIGASVVDKNYNLCISEYKDGSGSCVNIPRYFGNTRLLAVIEQELEKQLTEFKDEYSKL